MPGEAATPIDLTSLPYYRQEPINARSGVHTPRSTLASWGGTGGAALEPLYELHRRFILSCRVLHADETPLPLLDPGAGKTKRAYVWAWARSHHDPHPGVVYEFCLGRGAQYPLAFLGGKGPPMHEPAWNGTLITDQYAAYTAVVDAKVYPQRQSAGCAAHARRRFEELSRGGSSASAVAIEALRRWALIFTPGQETRCCTSGLNPSLQKIRKRRNNDQSVFRSLYTSKYSGKFRTVVGTIKSEEPIMTNRKYFHDSITDLPPVAGATATGLLVQSAEPVHLDEPLHLHFSLAVSSKVEKELTALVQAGKTVTAEDLNTKYGLGEADIAPLREWLTHNGYKITQETADHTSIFATAPAGTVSKTLEVELARVTKNGLTYTAARTVPSLPVDIAGKVHAIGGLQPFHHFNKHRVQRHPVSVEAASAVAVGKQASGQPPYLPSALLKAFGGDSLGLDGSGQTIAILIDTFPNDTDLTSFWSAANVPAKLSLIHKINVNGGALPAPEGEESLDAEWSSGIAPAASIAIYATGSLAFAQLDAGLQRILDDAKKTPSLRIVSISLGLGEQQTPPSAIRTQAQIFLRLAALGVNVFVSSGDDGASPNGILQVEYPSSDPNVIGVGGTTLRLNADDSIQSESGWAGSGGGKSAKFQRPSWQVGIGITAGSTRLVPDVAAAADPNTGALVMLNQKPQQIGGTSWAAPSWAAFTALINQARTKAGKGPLPFLNPLLYHLNGTGSFRDVTTGSNGAYHAHAGHDLVTGLGSPNLNTLLQKLIAI